MKKYLIIITFIAAIFASCDKKEEWTQIESKAVDYEFPPLLDKAPDGKKLRAGLVGCGNRGTGAALNFLAAGNDLELVALADIFEEGIKQGEFKDHPPLEIANVFSSVVFSTIWVIWAILRTMGRISLIIFFLYLWKGFMLRDDKPLYLN